MWWFFIRKYIPNSKHFIDVCAVVNSSLNLSTYLAICTHIYMYRYIFVCYILGLIKVIEFYKWMFYLEVLIDGLIDLRICWFLLLVLCSLLQRRRIIVSFQFSDIFVYVSCPFSCQDSWHCLRKMWGVGRLPA